MCLRRPFTSEQPCKPSLDVHRHWAAEGLRGWRGSRGRWDRALLRTRKRAAIRLLGLRVPPQCCQPSPGDSRKLPGTLSRWACGKFTKTASVTTHKTAPPAPHATHTRSKKARGRGNLFGTGLWEYSLSVHLTLCPYGERQRLRSLEVTLDPRQINILITCFVHISSFYSHEGLAPCLPPHTCR